jgi:hypothetical protein
MAVPIPDMLRFTVIILCLSCSTPVAARMYQWVDPASGTTQLSGKPPPWYRSGERGPRVYVFDKGKVIDDTGIRVSDSERERLRHEALLNAEQNSQQVREKLLEAKRLQAAMERDKRNRQTSTDTKKSPAAAQQARPKAEEQSTQRAVPTEQAMRALLKEWDKTRSKQSQQAASSGDSAAPAVNPPPPPPDRN